MQSLVGKLEYHFDKQDLEYTEIRGNDISAVWLKEDTHIKWKYFKKVKFLKQLSRTGTRDERNAIIDDFNTKLQRCYNDHKNILLNEHSDPSTKFEPYQVALFPNLVVLSGLTKMSEQLTNQSNTYFTFIEVGKSNTPVGLLNTSLAEPHQRVNVQDMGWFEPHGNTIRTGTIFPDDMASVLIKEIGCFDTGIDPNTIASLDLSQNLPPSVMWWRIVIDQPDRWLNHISNQTYCTVSHIHVLKGK